MLKAQQRALLVRHQHKDAIIQNIDDLQQSVTSPVFTCERPLTANVQNSTPEADVVAVNASQSSISPGAEIHNTGDTNSSQAADAHEPLVLKPNVHVRRSFRSSDYSSESFGQKITSDVPSYSDSLVGTYSAKSMLQQSSMSPLTPSIVKNSAQADSDSLSPVSSCYSSPLTVTDLRGNEPVKSLGIQADLPLAYMPPLTVSVTNTQFSVPNCQLGSPRYFDGKFDVMSSSESTVGTVGSSGETFSNSNSLFVKKPNCVFASKRVIANTYLSRRPRVFSPVFTGTQSNSISSQFSANSGIDSNSVRLSHSAADHATNISTVSTDSKRPSVAESSVTAVSSPAVPPRLSVDLEGQFLSHSSLPELHEASSSSVKPLVSQTAVSADNIAGRLSSACSTESLHSNSLLTDVVASSNSLPAVVMCGSASMPFQALSSTGVSAVSALPPPCAHDVLYKGTYSPALLSSDLSDERPLSEITYSSSVTAHVIPEVLDSLPQVTASFSNRLSAVVLPSDTGALQSVDLVTVSASSEVSSVSQLDGPGMQHSDKSSEYLPPSTVPSVCYTAPCMLTISTHIPVSSPAIDAAASLSHATLLDAVNDTLVVGAVSFSSNPIQSCSTTTTADIPHSESLSRTVPLSEASCELIGTTGDDVSGRCSHADTNSLPGALRLCTSSPRMTRRRLSADGAHASRMSSPPHASAQKHTDDSLEQTHSMAVDTTAEEYTADAGKLATDSVAPQSNDVETDAVFDDASSDIVPLEGEPDPLPVVQSLVTKQKRKDGLKTLQRVSFSPLALLLDASLEGDLELLMSTAKKVFFFLSHIVFLFQYTQIKLAY